MNAQLDKEQIEYIQSIVGETEFNYEKDEGDYTKEEFNERFYNSKNGNIDFDDFNKKSDEYWQELIGDIGEFILQRDEEEFRWYNIAKNIYKVGERYFETMVISESRSEQQTQSDIKEHYGYWEDDVTEVFPIEVKSIEVKSIDYVYTKPQ